MMKNLLVLSLCLLIGFNASAQLTKDEKKEWKQKYKAYKKDLEGFKDLVEENGNLKSQLSSTKNQLSAIQSEIAAKDAKIAEMQDQVMRMQSQVASARSAEQQAKLALASKPSGGGQTVMVNGVVFKVQIGAFKKKDMSKFFDNNIMFTGETEDGLQKITLGFFRDYWEADTLKKYLREMGVRDAWVVPYKDGTRVPIKDVLEGVI
jgi:hypothetical protein